MTKKKTQVQVKQLSWSLGAEEFMDLTAGRAIVGRTIVDGEEVVMEISLKDIGWEQMRSIINKNETLSKYPKIHE